MLSYSVKFDSKFGYYRARFWESGVSDSYVKVPDEFWRELGHEPQHTLPSTERQQRAMLNLAIGWAVAERDRRDKAIAAENAGRATKVMTIREVWDLYRAENPKRVSAETLQRDRISFDAIARHRDIIDVDRHTPEDVDEPMIVELQNALAGDTVRRRNDDDEIADAPLRNRSINNMVEWLVRMLKFSLRWQRRTGVKIIRTDRTDMLPEQASTQVALTEEQVGEILQRVDGWKRQVIIFGICSRLRRENLLGLRAEWISWPQQWLDIPAQFMKKGRSKTPRPLSIPLPQIALEQLGNPRLRGSIWVNPETALAYTKCVGLEAIADDAGVPRFSLHDLKTTGVTWLKMHKVDDLVRKVLAGHAHMRDEAGTFTVKTGDVTDLYTKVFVEQLREAVAIYDGIFRRLLRPTMKVVQHPHSA